ncbi:hypothetical protein MHYP_G00321820 [Metynnis hypsauchen]
MRPEPRALVLFSRFLSDLISVLQVVALNQRSKEAESAFLGVYKQLIEAPVFASAQVAQCLTSMLKKGRRCLYFSRFGQPVVIVRGPLEANESLVVSLLQLRKGVD